ncbi:matrixin family metalloprotease [Catelliglobosispora koreensis]|uniref:matrixin family metalloprotease n=1 Tax=Catelliglobosispora koreensis TaxID=129052 RepID=UPI0012F9CA8F|nr:matrixin family metalloprotease [Catelliglobosispora koreensis]
MLRRKHIVPMALTAIVAASTMMFNAPAYAAAAADVSATVVSYEEAADGTVTATIYTPAAGVTPDALAQSLTSSGVPNVSVKRQGDFSTMAVAPCSLGIARTWPSGTTCFVRWSYNGAVRPIINFVDHSSARWPVGRAVTEWNKTSGIDSIYRTASAGCDGAPVHCVHVYSGNYGNNGWMGITRVTYNSAQTYFATAKVELNNYYGGSLNTDWATACHELGHVLGLGHNNSLGSCMYKEDHASVSKYPHADDRKLLERYY